MDPEATDNPLRRFWFELPPDPRSLSSIWGWWERRRILFNLIILPAGFASFLLLITLTASAIHLRPGEDMVEPFAVLGAPIGLNILYTAGPICESMLWAVNRRRTGTVGPFLFALGTGAILLFMAFVVFWPFLFPGSVSPRPPVDRGDAVL